MLCFAMLWKSLSSLKIETTVSYLHMNYLRLVNFSLHIQYKVHYLLKGHSLLRLLVVLKNEVLFINYQKFTFLEFLQNDFLFLLKQRYFCKIERLRI